MKDLQNFSSPAFWGNVAYEVYKTFAESVVFVINDEILPELHQEVIQKLSDRILSGRDFIHKSRLIFKNDIWFSIHIQIHNDEEIDKPFVRVFAIVPFEGSSPFVLRLYPETDKQNQLDVYTPHFFKQYASRAERFSKQAEELGKMYKKYKVQSNSKREKLEEKCILPLNFFIGLFVAQNGFFLKTSNPRALSQEEQIEDNSGEKWSLVATDGIIYGKTLTEEGSPFILNVFLTNVGYDMLAPDQQAILLPLKEELERRYVDYMFKMNIKTNKY